MKEFMFTLKDGKKIFMRYFNDLKEAPTLLYLHGGPGADCEDFHYAAHCLSKEFNVIMIDQRGVLRSEGIEKDEPLTIQMLVEDCEYIRQYYHIDKWIVLGHSFGGLIALLYAYQYPSSVQAIIYENPNWSSIDAIKTVHQNTIKYLRESGYSELADRIECKINSSDNLTELVKLQEEIPTEILEKVYYNKPLTEVIKKHLNFGNITDEKWGNGIIHRDKILLDDNNKQNFLSYLEKIACPSLLIRGDKDPVMSQFFEDYFVKYSPAGKLVVLKDCGHTAHTDQAEDFCATIINFIDSIKR